MNSGGVIFLLLVLVAAIAVAIPEPTPKVTHIQLQSVASACEALGGWDHFNPTVIKTKINGKSVRTVKVTCKNGMVVQYDIDQPVVEQP
jgi:hypothetical protein